MLNLVMVNPSDMDRRMLIRQTWANISSSYSTKTVFICGLASTDNDSETNNLLKYESLRFNDIVQADFIESYWNLTLKTIIAFKWVSMHFTKDRVQYILKVDDDVVVRMENLLDRVSKQFDPNREAFYCYEVSGTQPVRLNKHKFKLTNQEYPFDSFPKYCSGSGYILTYGMLKKISDLSHFILYLKFEDVYFTGILRTYFDASIISLNHLYVTRGIQFNSLKKLKAYRFMLFYLNCNDIELFLKIFSATKPK